MKTSVSKVFQYVFWPGIAAVLLYFCLRGINWEEFWTLLQHCRWGWVVLSMGLGAVVFWLRALRWRMMLGLMLALLWNRYGRMLGEALFGSATSSLVVWGLLFGLLLLGILFATLSHESQLLTQVFFGTGSFLHESLRK